jgi:hypothetical protein
MIKQIDVVALVTAVLTSLGAAYTATLNFMHGRDDSREVIDFLEMLRNQSDHQTQETAKVTEMLNKQLDRITGMLAQVINKLP